MAQGYYETMVSWLSADAVTTEYTVNGGGGLSFTPKLVMVFCTGFESADPTSAGTGSNDWNVSIGFAESGGTRRSVSSFSDDANAAADDCGGMMRDDAVLHTVDGTGAVTGRLDIAFDADGIRLVVDDTAPVNMSVLVKIWGDDDDSMTVVVGDIAEPAATGNVDYTATGMVSGANADQMLLLAGCQSTAAANSGAATDSGIFFGAAHDSGQFVCCVNSDDASATSDTDHYGLSGECLAQIVLGGGNPNARASFVQWNTDGFRLNWAARATTNRRSIFAAIKGGQWAVGEYTIDASTASTTATVSGLSFQPQALLLATCSGAEETAGTSAVLAAFCIGGGTSTSDRRCLMIREDNGAATTAIWINVRYDCAVGMQNNGTGTRERWDINAINSDGFQMITDQANASDVTNWWHGYVAWAAAAGGTTYTKDMPDSVAVSDQRVKTQFNYNLHTDTVAIADERLSGIVRGRYMQGDAVSVIDGQFITRVRGRLMGDAIASLIDQQWLGRVRGRVMEDGVTVVDQLLVSRFLTRIFTDLVTISDEFSKAISGGLVVQVTLSDAVAITDQLLCTRYRQRTHDDPVGLTDELLATRYRNRTPADTIVLTDGTILTRERIRVWSDQLQITDMQLHFLLRTIIASDQISVSDQSLVYRLRLRDLVDAFGVVDDFAYTISGAVPALTTNVRVRIGVAPDPTEVGLDVAAMVGVLPGPELSQDNDVVLGSATNAILGGSH